MNSSQFLFWEFAALPLQFWEADHATLTANETAQTAEFFSFGTNDLTKTCLGMSRDDSGPFIPACTEVEIIKKKSLRTAIIRLD